MFNGEGSMIHSSGVSYEGMWVNGRPEGEKSPPLQNVFKSLVE